MNLYILLLREHLKQTNAIHSCARTGYPDNQSFQLIKISLL